MTMGEVEDMDYMNEVGSSKVGNKKAKPVSITIITRSKLF